VPVERWNQRRWKPGHAGDLLRDVPYDGLHYGHLPTPAPCGCPSCAPAPDAGVAKDAGRADTPLPVCPMLANLNSRTLCSFVGQRTNVLECKFTGGTTEDCLSNDVTAVPARDDKWGLGRLQAIYARQTSTA